MSAARELFQARMLLIEAGEKLRAARARFNDSVGVFMDQCAPNGIEDEHLEGRALLHMVPGWGAIAIEEGWHEYDEDNHADCIKFLPGNGVTHAEVAS